MIRLPRTASLLVAFSLLTSTDGLREHGLRLE